MEMGLTEEQKLLQDSVRRFVADEYGFDQRQKWAASPAGYAADHWRNFAELGWLGLSLPEAEGGLGMGMIELGLVMEQFGRGLAMSPFLGTVIGAELIAGLGSPAQRAQLLPPILAGEIKLALAHLEPGMAPGALEPGLAALAQGGAYRLSGMKSWVDFGAAADYLLLSARTAEGTSLFLLSQDSPGLARRDFQTQDGGRAASFTLTDLDLPATALLGPAGGAAPALARAFDRWAAALVAEAAGIATAIYEKTLAYLKTREQFGRKLGSFQALQHRLADLLIKSELMQSAARDAAEAADLAAPQPRAAGVAAAKFLIGRYGRELGKEGVQLHGGIGMTWDYEIGHYLKRLVAIDLAFGDSRHQLMRYRKLTQEASP